MVGQRRMPPNRDDHRATFAVCHGIACLAAAIAEGVADTDALLSRPLDTRRPKQRAVVHLDGRGGNVVGGCTAARAS